MTILPPLESLRDAAWNLEDFVAEVNRRLLTLQQGGYGDTSQRGYSDARQREDFSVRLLRHYANLGLVGESERVGREARYRYRHLLQILCLRQLQRQGWNSKAIADFTSRETSELELFLNSAAPDSNLQNYSKEIAVPAASVVPAPAPAARKMVAREEEASKDDALEYLDSLRSRATSPTQQIPAPLPQFLLHDPPKIPEQWRHIEIAPGLEVHISDRYRAARNATDKRRLLERLEETLENS